MKTNDWQMRPHETKNFCTTKTLSFEQGGLLQNKRKIFTSYASDRGFMSKMYKTLKKEESENEQFSFHAFK